MSNRFRFPKPVALYKTLTPYGPYILASEHNDWKRYRKVSAPAFTEVIATGRDARHRVDIKLLFIA